MRRSMSFKRAKVLGTDNSPQESSYQQVLLQESSLTLGKRLKKIFLGSQENSIIMPESISELTNISTELSQEISQEDINKINREFENFDNENTNSNVYIQDIQNEFNIQNKIIIHE